MQDIEYRIGIDGEQAAQAVLANAEAESREHARKRLQEHGKKAREKTHGRQSMEVELSDVSR